MSTVTIGKSYFDALLRRAEFYTSAEDLVFGTDLSNHVTISKDEHNHLIQAEREYRLLKSALFRGGLKSETLDTLLAGEDEALGEPSPYEYVSDETMAKSSNSPASASRSYSTESSPSSNLVVRDRMLPSGAGHAVSYDELESSVESPYQEREDPYAARSQAAPVSAQRTVLITNLPKHTTYKDLVGVARGGRLLNLILRDNRSATLSFVEDAAEFMAYAKRTDIYLHTKRLEFRWCSQQFRLLPHVADKIAGGATRNLVIRGVAGKLTEDEIRDHLDHIHNLVVVDISFKNGDAYVSTNSIPNALFARTCMMSRTVYKGKRIEYYADECAVPLPCLESKGRAPVRHVGMKSVPLMNQYSLLGNEPDAESESDDTI